MTGPLHREDDETCDCMECEFARVELLTAPPSPIDVLGVLREELDRIDFALVEILGMRARQIAKVADAKALLELVPHDLDRERDLLERARARLLADGFSAQELSVVLDAYRATIERCRIDVVRRVLEIKYAPLRSALASPAAPSDPRGEGTSGG